MSFSQRDVRIPCVQRLENGLILRSMRDEGDVERFEMPNLMALNFLLHKSLGGGGTLSLRTDAQAKTFSAALLRMEIDFPDELSGLIDG